jgi:acyl-CoA thioesterase-1
MRKVVAVLALLLLASAAARAEPVHIVAFGDSATAGYLVPRDQAYPAQLQRALRAKGYDVAVTNAGVSGDTTAGALRRFDEAIAPGTKMTIVEFGTNDLRLRVPAAKMRANLNEIVRTLRARRIAVLVVGLGSLDLSDVARANNVPTRNGHCRRANIAPVTARISMRKVMRSWSRACCRRWRHW